MTFDNRNIMSDAEQIRKRIKDPQYRSYKLMVKRDHIRVVLDDPGVHQRGEPFDQLAERGYRLKGIVDGTLAFVPVDG